MPGVSIAMSNIVIQVSPIYAALIALALALVGILIGVWSGWFLTGRDLNRARRENAALRIAHHEADAALAQAVCEHDRVLQELRHEFTVLEAQHHANKQQLEQAHIALRALEQRAEEIGTILRSTRIQNDGLRAELHKSGYAASERQSAQRQKIS